MQIRDIFVFYNHKVWNMENFKGMKYVELLLINVLLIPLQWNKRNCVNLTSCMMTMNCFCSMVDRRKAFNLISSQDHCQRPSPSQISATPQAGFELAQNLSSGFIEWSCAVVITTTPRRHKPLYHGATYVIVSWDRMVKHTVKLFTLFISK